MLKEYKFGITCLLVSFALVLIVAALPAGIIAVWLGAFSLLLFFLGILMGGRGMMRDFEEEE